MKVTSVDAQSGFRSVQFRAVRKPDDMPEAGLEVVKVSSNKTLADAAARLQSVNGQLCVFHSQNALCFRVQDPYLKSAREKLFADDDRFSPSNVGAKCVRQYKILGFPRALP